MGAPGFPPAPININRTDSTPNQTNQAADHNLFAADINILSAEQQAYEAANNAALTAALARIAALETGGTTPGQGNPVFTASGAPNGTVSVAYSYTFAATGTPAPTFTVTGATLASGSYSGGPMPAGLSLNATTGVLSGTPTTAATYVYTVNAVNNVGSVSASQTTVISASGAITVPSARGYGSVSYATLAWNDEFDGGTAQGANGHSSGTPNANGCNSLGVNLTRWENSWLAGDNVNSHAVNGAETAGYSWQYVSVANGVMLMKTDATAISAGGTNYSHTGCLVNTKNKTNGTWTFPQFVEVRAWLPCANGVLINNQAIWFNELNNLSEPDMYENLGGNWHNHMHGFPHPYSNDPAASPASSPTVSGWHEFAMHFTSTFVDVYYDKVLVNHVTSVPSDTWYSIIDHGTGPSVWGPDNLPATMQIEFYRRWSP